MHTARSLRKPSLLAGCALGAVLTALPGAAAAQGLQGTPTVAAGTAAISTAPGYTMVVPTSTQVVINWEPFDNVGLGTINFLPTGMTAEFAEVTGTFDYTVLNRILPVDPAKNPVNRVVAFNGTVFSRVGNFPGGDIWFYSPTGIIAGPTAVFNVGSLILTTNDIPFVVGGASPLYGPGGLVKLQGPAGSTGFVQVQAGAQITATAGPFGPAYVALVAPRVVQAGQVTSNGTIGYLAAEQVDMTINGGLFDFTLTVGTTDALGNGVVHTGTTAGPASTSAADLQRISIAVLPKNAAMTMLLSGSIGYTPAAVAANEGSSVVLSAGFATDDPTVVPANRLGSIDIATTTFRNRLIGYATDAIDVAPGVTTSFAGPTTLFAVNSIDLTSTISTAITAASTLSLFAGQPGTGGTIDLNALGGGQITAAGGFTLNAGGDAATYDTVTTFVDAAGGTINIFADGGTISTPLDLVADVGATGGFDPALGGQGGGGTINVVLDNNGVIGADTMLLTALGRGGTSDNTGGNGIGGSVTVTENDGQLNLVSMRLFAQGAGGDAAVRAGDGSGGGVNVDLFNQAQDIDNVYLDASASAGLPTAPGGVSGHASSAPDAVRLSVAGPASLDVLSGIELNADARSGIEIAAGLGGQAGGVALEAVDGGTITAGFVDLHTNAFLRGDTPDIVPGNSPIQQGGLVAVLVDGPGSSIVTQSFSAAANATGHEATTTAGSATGGTAQVIVSNGGALTVDNGAGDALLRIVAEAYGGPGPVAADAFGGTARLVLEDGSVDVLGDIEVSATGESPELGAATGGEGFDATGGNASLELLAGAIGTASLNANNVTIAASGDARVFTGVFLPAGDPIQGDGGNGLGGTAGVMLDAGTLTTGLLRVESAGTGGASAATDAGSALTSGDGTGGTTRLVQSGGTGTVTTLQLDSAGRGGGGAPAATGGNRAALAGDGTGGTSLLRLFGGSFGASDTTLAAIGTGGAGMGHEGSGAATNGGNGLGGSIQMQSPSGWTGDFMTSTLTLTANGVGGDGGVSASGTSGNGGNGRGFSALVDLADGEFSLGAVTIEATGTGGDGVTGGEGAGGQARFALIDSPAGPTGPRSLASLAMDTSGYGGVGAGGFGGLTDDGDLIFTANVRDAAAALDIAGALSLLNTGGPVGPGAGINVFIAGAPLTVGGAVMMSASEDVNINAAQPLHGLAQVEIGGNFVRTTGLVQADGFLAIGGSSGVDVDRLSSGDRTDLISFGAIAVNDLLSVGPVTAQGGSVDIASTGALTFADLDATAGPISVVTAGGLDLATVDATGAITLRSTGGAVTATGNVIAGGSATVDGADGVTLPFLRSGGTTLLNSGGTVDVDTLVSLGTVAVTGNAVDIGGSGDLTFTTAQATGPLSVITSGDLAFGAVSAGNALRLESTLGSLTATGNVAGGATTLLAADDILLEGNLTATGALAATAGGSFTIEGAASATGTNIVAPDGITLASLNTGGNPLFQADNGAITIEQLLTFGQITARGRAIDIASTGGLFFGEATATAGNITILAAGELVTNTVTATGLVDLRTSGDYMRAVGTVTGGTVLLTAFDRIEAANLFSTTSLTVDAGASFILSGLARGATVSVTSANIQIGATARIGVRGTTDTITLRNRNAASVMFLGGAAEPTGYSLDQAEAGRLFADDSIEFAASGDVEVHDLALTFGGTGNIGTGGTLEITTPDEVLITGDVALTTSGANDTFLIDPTFVGLDSTTGSIALLDASGNPLGRVQIVGDTIAVASTNALTQLRTLTDMAAINTLLDTPAGTGLPVRAGTILVDADDGFFVQNSGASTAFADRRGFAAGALEITTESTATRIAINGQILTPAGPVSGLATAPLIRINGAVPAAGGQFNALSTINGCVIGANCAPVPIPDPEPDIPDFTPPTSEDVDPIPPREGPGALFVAPLIELAGTEPLITPPLVDEPITGVGNDDLWEPRCDPAEEDGGVCPEGEREP
jgi:hypothetical protein